MLILEIRRRYDIFHYQLAVELLFTIRAEQTDLGGYGKDADARWLGELLDEARLRSFPIR